MFVFFFLMKENLVSTHFSSNKPLFSAVRFAVLKIPFAYKFLVLPKSVMTCFSLPAPLDPEAGVLNMEKLFPNK